MVKLSAAPENALQIITADQDTEPMEHATIEDFTRRDTTPFQVRKERTLDIGKF